MAPEVLIKPTLAPAISAKPNSSLPLVVLASHWAHCRLFMASLPLVKRACSFFTVIFSIWLEPEVETTLTLSAATSRAFKLPVCRVISTALA
jgi:hypothetical protein